MHPRLVDKPLLYDAHDALRHGIIAREKTGDVTLRSLGSEQATTFCREHFFDIVGPTMHGLQERLTRGTFSPRLPYGKTLRDAFDDAYVEFLLTEKKSTPAAYGTFAWYKKEQDLVHYAPAFWHRVNLVASGGSLYRDPERKLSWYEVRERLSSLVVGVAGCSVGSSVIHALVSDMRPRTIKIADRSRYKMENTNRVRITYRELPDATDRTQLAKKAPTVARQLYALDPYLNVFTYDEGIDSHTISSFFDGDGVEPPIDMVVDEVDDPAIKILLREEARKRKIPLIMVTDVGSTVQLDVCRFDLDPTLCLTHGTKDSDLYATRDLFETNKNDRSAFFAFVDALIGTAYRQGELGEILSGDAERPSETLFAQLGSTVMMAGGIAAETVARLRLGYPVLPRTFFHKQHTL